jgi:hypothetical protein
MAQNFNIGTLGQSLTVNTSANTVALTSILVIGNSTSNVVVNSSSVYVNGAPLGGSTNVAAQYTWTNLHTFNANVNVNAATLFFGNSTSNGFLSSNVIQLTQNVAIGRNPVSTGGGYAGYANFGVGGGGVDGGLSLYNTANVLVLDVYTSGNTINFFGEEGINFQVGSYFDTASLYANGMLEVVDLKVTSAITANGTVGTNGQVLTSNGTEIYWGAPAGVNTSQQYTWTNAHTYTANITVGNSSLKTFIINESGSSRVSYGIQGSNATHTSYVNTFTFGTGGVGGIETLYSGVSPDGSYSQLSLELTNQTFGNGAVIYLTRVSGSNSAYAELYTNQQRSSLAMTMNGKEISLTTNTSQSQISLFDQTDSTTNTQITINDIRIGNSTVNITINSTSFSGTANNSTNLGGVVAANYVQNTDSRTLSGNLVFSGANVNFTGNLRVTGGLLANGSLGTSGQVLTSNGTSTYWATAAGGGSVNTAAQYTWTNTHTFSANVTFGAAIIANSSSGSAGQVLTSNGSAVYWSTVSAPSSVFPIANVISNTAFTAVKDNRYFLTNASSTTVTLPSSPSVGDTVYIVVVNNLANNTVARNGSNIMSLAENLTLDINYFSIGLTYVTTNTGWVIV